MSRARNYNPALTAGFKIYPEDLAGMLGLPYVGSIFYIDPSGGSDSDTGESQTAAVATAATAYGLMTTGYHDVALIAPSGGTGRTSETTAITWAKRFAHLIGNAAPTSQDARAGLGFGAGGSFVGSENGSIFSRLTFFSSEDIDETVSFTGDYNSFQGCDFKGTSNATSADSTPWRALNLNGAEENSFYSCTFGADTYTRGAGNATIEFENAASRNYFENCRFRMHNDTANTPVHILLTGTSAIDRDIEFKDCSWYSFWTNHADKTAAVIDASAQTATGDIQITGSYLAIGFDDWEATASNIVWFSPYTATTIAIGLAINNA